MRWARARRREGRGVVEYVRERGPQRARNDSERNRRYGGIHTEEMSQYLIGVPTPVTIFAEIGNGCRFEQLFVGASKGWSDHEVPPLRLVLSAGIGVLATLDCFGDLGDPL